MNYKKDLKLAFPKSLWYQLSTSNTFSSRCKLHNKPTWNKRINISNWQIFKVKLKVNLFAEFHSTYVNVWLTKKKKGFLYSCGILFLKNDSRKGGEILYRRFPPKKKKRKLYSRNITKPGRKRFFNNQRHSYSPPHENNELHVVRPVENMWGTMLKKHLSCIKSIRYFTHEWKTAYKEKGLYSDKLITFFMYDD